MSMVTGIVCSRAEALIAAIPPLVAVVELGHGYRLEHRRHVNATWLHY